MAKLKKTLVAAFVWPALFILGDILLLTALIIGAFFCLAVLHE